CLKGYLTMLSCKAANVPAAGSALADARRHGRDATAREQLHVDALAYWHGGDIEAALGVWEAILTEYPLDLVAMRLAHFNYFWRGEAEAMRDSVLGRRRAWSKDVPGYGTYLAMSAFGYEECGDYADAERTGREAVALDPADLWATHAVAHVI